MPDGRIARALAEYGPELEREQRKVQRERRVLRIKLGSQEYAEDFLEKAEQSEYQEAFSALCQYLKPEITLSELCNFINKHLEGKPVYLHCETDGKRCTLDRDWGGTVNGWKELALLIESTETLDRIRMCSLPECGKVFWNSSPNSQWHHCTRQHANTAAKRTERDSPQYKQPQRRRRELRKKYRKIL